MINECRILRNYNLQFNNCYVHKIFVEKLIKRPFSVWIIIGIAVAYGFYSISVFLKTGSFLLLIPRILSFASAIGLILNKGWSYAFLC